MLKHFKLTILIILCNAIVFGQNRPTDRTFATPSENVAQHSMAATSHPLAYLITVKSI